MSLQEAKLVRDWTKQKLDDVQNERPYYHEKYIEAKNRYILLQNLYDKMCEDWIENNIENKQLNNPSL